MRLSLTSGILLVTAVLASAIYRPISFNRADLGVNLAKLLDSKKSTGNHFVQKRQNQACINAYLETETEQFQECSRLLGDGGNVTTNEILEFCDRDDCVSLLIKVFTDLHNCDAVDDNSTVSIWVTIDP